jgi:hypothetical protein
MNGRHAKARPCPMPQRIGHMLMCSLAGHRAPHGPLSRGTSDTVPRHSNECFRSLRSIVAIGAGDVIRCVDWAERCRRPVRLHLKCIPRELQSNRILPAPDCRFLVPCVEDSPMTTLLPAELAAEIWSVEHDDPADSRAARQRTAAEMARLRLDGTDTSCSSWGWSAG